MGKIARVLQRLGLSGDAVLMLEDALGKIYTIEMVDSADVGGGGTTRAGVGFQVLDANGDHAEEEHLLSFGVYDEVELVTPATTATLDTATAGSIVSGAASATLVVKTSATGAFACTLTDVADEVVYMGCTAGGAGGLIADCRDTDSVEFTA